MGGTGPIIEEIQRRTKCRTIGEAIGRWISGRTLSKPITEKYGLSKSVEPCANQYMLLYCLTTRGWFNPHAHDATIPGEWKTRHHGNSDLMALSTGNSCANHFIRSLYVRTSASAHPRGLFIQVENGIGCGRYLLARVDLRFLDERLE